MSEIPKHHRYAGIIVKTILDALSEEDHPNHFEVKESELTEFIHALATIAPAYIFNHLSGEDKNHLEFNHLANQLCFQFMNKDK